MLLSRTSSAVTLPPPGSASGSWCWQAYSSHIHSLGPGYRAQLDACPWLSLRVSNDLNIFFLALTCSLLFLWSQCRSDGLRHVCRVVSMRWTRLRPSKTCCWRALKSSTWQMAWRPLRFANDPSGASPSSSEWGSRVSAWDTKKMVKMCNYIFCIARRKLYRSRVIMLLLLSQSTANYLVVMHCISSHTIGSAVAVIQVRVGRTRRSTVKQTNIPDWWRWSWVCGTHRYTNQAWTHSTQHHSRPNLTHCAVLRLCLI